MALNLQIRDPEGLARSAARLEQWLCEQAEFREAAPKLVDVSYVDGAGSSNETARATLVLNGAARDVIFRQGHLTPHSYMDNRLGRQVGVIDWVRRNTEVPVANVIASDASGEVLGRPFLLMDRIEGRSASDFPGYNVEGFIFDMDEADRRRLWDSAMGQLVRLHRADTAGLEWLDFPGGQKADLPGLVAHWETSYHWAADDVASPFFDRVLAWLKADQPMGAPQGLSWGDARIANMMFRGGLCVAVLDWEMASLGGPVLDLAWWLLFDRIQDEDTGVSRLPGLPGRNETIAAWQEGTGLPIDSLFWYEVMAVFQIAVTRAKSFGYRRAKGLPYPQGDDTRSVARLEARLRRLLGD